MLNGYARRTQEIVRAQRDAGIQADVLTATDGQHSQVDRGAVADIVGWHTCMPEKSWGKDCLQQVTLAVVLLNGLKHALLRAPRPDVIHAHVPWPCAVAAHVAHETFGVPWVYEVRGIQEESAVAEGTHVRDSCWYQIWRRMETWARQNANATCAIAPMLVEDARQRGAKRVFLTPNAVDVSRFCPVPPADRAAVRRALGLNGHPVVAYFGSVRPLEGVEELVRMASDLPVGRDMHCLVVGNGNSVAGLKRVAGPNIEFRAAVPPEQVMMLMSVVDAVAITRPDTVVTRLVTPLKPLEVLACETPVVSSDLPALRYVGEAGTLFYPPGDLSALAACLHEATERAKALGEEGRAWVSRERTWAQTVAEHRRAYEEVIEAS